MESAGTSENWLWVGEAAAATMIACAYLTIDSGRTQCD